MILVDLKFFNEVKHTFCTAELKQILEGGNNKPNSFTQCKTRMYSEGGNKDLSRGEVDVTC